MIYEQIAELCRRIEAFEKKNTGIIAELNASPISERRAKLYARKQINQEAIDELKHDIHCLAVVEGIADHNPERYGNIEVTGPFGKTTVYRRDPFGDNLEDNSTTIEHADGAITKVEQGCDGELSAGAIKQRREELEQVLRVEENLRQNEMQNRSQWAYEQLNAFNAKYPPNE